MNTNHPMESFGATEARLKLRDALDSVLTGHPVAITRNGRAAAILVGPDWYDRAVRALFNAEVNDPDGDE